MGYYMDTNNQQSNNPKKTEGERKKWLAEKNIDSMNIYGKSS